MQLFCAISRPPEIYIVSLSSSLTHTSYKVLPTRITPESSWSLLNRSPSVPQGQTGTRPPPQISGLGSRAQGEMLTVFSDEVKL